MDGRRRYAALAEILEYPGPGLQGQVDACLASLGEAHPAAASLRAFRRALADAPVGRLQESYTAAFDLDERCSPHVGHRLLGADPRRGFLLAWLAGRFRACGFSAGRELPDHVAVLLRFVAVAPDGPERAELVRDGLLPAVASLAQELGRRAHPYAPVAEAVRIVLEEDAQEGAGAR